MLLHTNGRIDTGTRTASLDDAYFAVRFPFHPRRELVWKEVCRYLQTRFVPVDARVLDLGAGYCSFINNIRAGVKHAVDLSPLVLEYANADVVPHVHSCTNLDFLPDRAFDVVFASNLFEHLTREELALTLDEVRRVLVPGGRLIALQPNFTYCYREYFHDYTHVQIFTHEGLADRLAACGFRVRNVFPRFLPVNMKSRFALKLPLLHLITRCYLHLPFKPMAGQMLVVVEQPCG